MIKIKIYKDKQFLVFDFEDGRSCKYDFATKTSIGIKGKPVKNLQNQLRGLTINGLMDCCIDKQYAKFLKFVKRSESNYYPINKLISEFGYNAKDLWLYLDRLKTFEAIENMRDLIHELYDYANIMKQLSPKFDKYPRHFLTTHKIACRNYNRMKKEFSEELFRKRINKEYECSFENYVFIYPKCTQDIKDEAVQMSNCVASYIDKVIDGDCHILFLRKKDKPKESLVTIEVRDNRIVQAKRRFNDDVTSEDQQAIDTFNRKFANGKELAA